MRQVIEVENIKCGGCARTITDALLAIDGVGGVDVDIPRGAVSFDGPDTAVAEATNRLDRLGYPVTGSVDGVRAAVAKAKSFASCAVGRMHD